MEAVKGRLDSASENENGAQDTVDNQARRSVRLTGQDGKLSGAQVCVVITGPVYNVTVVLVVSLNRSYCHSRDWQCHVKPGVSNGGILQNSSFHF